MKEEEKLKEEIEEFELLLTKTKENKKPRLVAKAKHFLIDEIIQTLGEREAELKGRQEARKEAVEDVLKIIDKWLDEDFRDGNLREILQPHRIKFLKSQIQKLKKENEN